MKKIILFFTCLMFAGGALLAQTIQVSGVVTDASDRSPLPGATVVVKGTNTIALSGNDGRFVISAPSNGALLVSFIGMTTAEININGRSVINVALESDSQLLQDVVVVAYGVQRKEAVTGAVATVKAETLERRPVSVATAALEGMALGVQVNNSYGEPGASTSIRIRGFNSINGSNEPFYVVNGVPMGGNVSDIHSSDIESITILKDASSAALYGNKASNGVVMITTKSGRMGEDNLTVQANVNFGVYQRGMKDYERLNAEQYMETYWLGRRNALYTDNPTKYATWSDANADVLPYVKDGLVYNIFNKDWSQLYDANGKLTGQMLPGYADDLDWWKPLTRTGVRNDYNLSLRGGSRRASYYMSIGYLDEQGYTKQSGMERFTTNARMDVTPTKWFKAGLSLNGSNQTTDFMSGGGGTSFINPFYFARNVAPIYPVHLHDPRTGEYILDGEGKKIYDDGVVGELTRPQNNSRHIVWETELNKDRSYRNTLNTTAYIEINFLKDFVFTVKGNVNNRFNQNKTYNSALVGDGKGSNGRTSETNQRYREYTFQQLLTWKRTFNGVHSVDALVGHENFSYLNQYSYVYKTDEKFANLMEISNFNIMTQMNGYRTTNRTEGFLSRLSYNYDNKYFIEGMFRRDGSSRFHADNRWGNFWSVGGSWILTREAFMANVPWVDYLKFRTAYGHAGKDDSAGNYAWMALYFGGSNGGNGALYKSQNEAKDLNWEKSGSFSIALESNLFKRANFTVEYYDKRSIDLIHSVTMPSSYGAVVNGSAGGAATSVTGNRPTIAKNFGSMSNKGLEIGLFVDVVQTKDFTWNLGTNFNLMRNKIVSLPDEYKGDGYISGSFRYLEGYSRYEYWLFQYAGLDRSDGRALYRLDDKLFYIPVDGYTGSGARQEDETRTAMTAANYKIIDGEAYVYQTTFAKRDWSGSSLPKVYGSFSTSFTYKGLLLSGLFTYELGGKTYDSSYLSLMGMTATPSAAHVDLLKAWSPEKAGVGIDPNGIPMVNVSQSSWNNAGNSTRNLISGNYITIRNVTLSYIVPRKQVEKIGLKDLLISVTGENLAIFTLRQGTDPQQAWNGVSENVFQPARVISMGLNVKF
ncbi:MAG: SusC/RagA family TonB-linked outer membrane protein [Bacteroidales bacterium]|nr:SusC/RagA family TonB-linked outer membrane protein [Bacteroidales bacterium]